MTRDRKSTAAPILIAAFCLLVPLAAYVAGYLWLGKKYLYARPPATPLLLVRRYPHAWQKHFFYPASRVESLVRGIEVDAAGETDP